MPPASNKHKALPKHAETIKRRRRKEEKEEEEEEEMEEEVGEVIFVNPFITQDDNTTENKKEEKKEKPLSKTPFYSQTQTKSIQELCEEAGSEDTEAIESWRTLGLHTALCTILVKHLGFKHPTRIQQASIAGQITGTSAILAGPTGEGKTLAFGLPVAQALLEAPKARQADTDGPSCLVLAPTRDLAQQTAKLLRPFVPCSLLVGGASLDKQRRLLDRCAPIIVATPGRLLEVIEKVRHPQILSMLGLEGRTPTLRHLILDEADRMLQGGRYPELDVVLSLVRSGLRDGSFKKGQLRLVLVSATLSLPHVKGVVERDLGHQVSAEQEKVFKGMLVDEVGDKVTTSDTPPQNAEEKRNAVLLKTLSPRLHGLHSVAPIEIYDTTTQIIVPKTVTETFAFCPSGLYRDAFILYILLNSNLDTLVFCNTRKECRLLSSLLSICHITNRVIEGNKDVKKRARALEYMDGAREDVQSPRVLLCTDLVARGTDLPSVSCVIHYDMPQTPDVYIHRTGRTGRAGRSGLSIACLTPVVVEQTSHSSEKNKKNKKKGKGKNTEGEKVLPVHPALLSIVGAGRALLTHNDLEAFREEQERADNELWALNQKHREMVAHHLEADDDATTAKHLGEIEKKMEEVEEKRANISKAQDDDDGKCWVSEFCVDPDLLESYFEPAKLARECAVLSVKIEDKEKVASVVRRQRAEYERGLEESEEETEGDEEVENDREEEREKRKMLLASKRRLAQMREGLSSTLHKIWRVDATPRMQQAHKRQREALEVLRISPAFQEESRLTPGMFGAKQGQNNTNKNNKKRTNKRNAPPSCSPDPSSPPKPKKPSTEQKPPKAAPDLLAVFRGQRV